MKMHELIIIEKECEVNKRRLVLSFDCDGKHYRFEHDHWNDWEDDKTKPPRTNRLTIDGEEVQPEPAIVVKDEVLQEERWPFTVLMAYKHCVQAVIHEVGTEKDMLFIDRRYDHNYMFNVYFRGEAFDIGDDKERPLKGEETDV